MTTVVSIKLDTIEDLALIQPDSDEELDKVLKMEYLSTTVRAKEKVVVQCQESNTAKECKEEVT